MSRPQKYSKIIKPLINPKAIYSPAMLTDLYQGANGVSATERRKVRCCMNALRLNHNFPEDGDGNVVYKKVNYKGWLGSRWLEAFA